MTGVVTNEPRPWAAADGLSTVLRGARLGVGGRPADLRVEDGRVTAIGDAAGTAPSDRVVDAAGTTVLPGLWDAHVHAVQWATTRSRIDVTVASSLDHAAQLVADGIADRGTDVDGPVVGYGFRASSWPEPPHKRGLGGILPTPVMLISNDLHEVCLNQAALDRLGRSDHPTGLFVEADALEQIAALSATTDEVVDEWLHEAMVAAARRGVTGLMDFEVADNLTAWLRRHRRRPLPMRVTATVYPAHLEAAIGRGLRTGEVVDGSDGMLEVGHLKIFVDGSLNARTALCHEPYQPAGEPASHGVVTTGADELRELMRRGAAHGITPAVHAIGDRAVTIAIDAFETVGCTGRIEHAQLIGADDLPRLRDLGITVGVQPAHIPGDRDVADRVWPGRTGRAFALGDLVRHDVPIEVGSDAPVAPLDPWLGIAAAAYRTDDDREPWHPEQAISLATALSAAARGRARVGVGDPADLVFVAGDLAAASPTELARTTVRGTMVGGHWTHRDGLC
jgi:predicted amidohydrolase YtcJ